MSKNADKIVVAGDVCIDWIGVSVPPKDIRRDSKTIFNWQVYPGIRMVAKPGGALLLAQFVRQATGKDVITHRLGKLENIPPDEVIHSAVELDQFPMSSDNKDADNKLYRVKRFGGFCGPSTGLPKIMGVEGDDPDAKIIVIDDGGNGFRDTEEAWPSAIRMKEKSSTVVFKMSRPLAQGSLWDVVINTHASNLVVVINANDLREEGANISRGLSWERTATDLVWQMAWNPNLEMFSKCVHLVVRFGIDGAIHYTRRDGQIESRFYYDPKVVEGGFRDNCPGNMIGFNCAFCSALVKRIVNDGIEAVGEGIRDGIHSSRRLFLHGFGTDADRLDYPDDKLFGPVTKSDAHIADILIPNPTQSGESDPHFWCILKDLAGKRLEEFTYDIMRKGEVSALQDVPKGQFGELDPIDRAEIESYRSVRNLILEYMATVSPNCPLSIAVFGPPGSGKSFGVAQVARSVASEQIEQLEFNVAQFGSPADLVSALHKVRDVVLGGKLPLVFFDEFDSVLGEIKLGWLKYFLAPMQDGKFKDGETMHPIGRAIFVFAGGTSSTFEEFVKSGLRNKEGDEAKDVKKNREYNQERNVEDAVRKFKEAKGPDFVSRLRGHVNVMGANPTDEEDNLFMIRRGVILRVLLKKKAKHLFDTSSKEVRIDAGVLRAFVKVPEYKHGVRSLGAIIDMSMLSDRKFFEQSALPPAKQLELHVDAQIFSKLVVRDVLFGAALEKIAKAIHEKYLRNQEGKKPSDHPAMRPWEELAEDYKESNRGQAEQIPEKLKKIGYGFIPVTGRKPNKIEFTPEEVEVLAKMEHERFVTERQLADWRPDRNSERSDPVKKTSPYLIDWDELEEKVKDWDRQPMREIPEIMADAGFELYRL